VIPDEGRGKFLRVYAMKAYTEAKVHSSIFNHGNTKGGWSPSRPVPFTTGEGDTSTHSTRGWVGPRSDKDILKKKVP